MRTLLLIASIALVQAHASAAPCQTGTLESYIALGSTGCILGNLHVANFAYQAKSSGGAAEITAKEITVTPLLPPIGMFALEFAAKWSINSGQDQFSGITYNVVAASTTMPVQELRLDGNGFKAGLFGSVAVNEIVETPSGLTQKIEVDETCDETCKSKTSATLDLKPPAPALKVVDDVSLQSKLGSVSMTSFTDWFVICIPCV